MRWVGLTVSLAAIALVLVAAETAMRVIDGYPLMPLRLAATTAPAPGGVTGTAINAADQPYFEKVALSPAVDPAWYKVDPPPHARIPMTPEIAARFKRYENVDSIGAFFVWNREYLRANLCAGLRIGALGLLDDFYVFDPPTPTQYPVYRHLPNISPPGWFPTTEFGWRGRNIPLNKAPRTIRIAFVGSSMTIDPYGLPHSHIELIGEWLTRWSQARGHHVRIEVINAARTGIDSLSVQEIVTQELLPLEPDLVIYDGANDFRLGVEFQFPKEGFPPPATVAARWRLEDYSALARRVRTVVDRARLGREPAKPSLPLHWPSQVDEQEPDLAAKSLPMQLQLAVRSFDVMREALAAQGAQLAITSQAGMVYDGMVLQMPRDRGIYDFLNVLNYPISYADTRRLLDFQNRLFRRYAEQHRLPFFDKAATYPADPALFLDLFHMTPAGLRLQSWIYLQWLTAWLDGEIGAGRLPRPMQQPRDRHPAFPPGGYPVVSKASLMAGCR